MIDLDDPSLAVGDRSGMLGHIRGLGRELQRAWDAHAGFVTPGRCDGIEQVVVAGMGGSATAGDYFATLSSRSSPVPVLVVRGPRLPAFAGERTLVVVSSYSGETTESLACYQAARQRRCPVIAVTTGGRLAAAAADDGTPVARIGYSSPPRAAIAHTIAPLLRLGAVLGLLPLDDAAIASAASECDTYIATSLAPNVPSEANIAKQVARGFPGRVPLVLGGEHLTPVATRFKNQLAENGKMFAIAEALPEAAHNIVVGLETVGRDGPTPSAVLLESPLYDGTLERVASEMTGLFRLRGIAVARVEIPGSSVLSQMLTGTALGDYVSCYAALQHGIDPTPIPEIERMRAATR